MKKRLARNRNEQKREDRVRQIRLPRLNEADAVVPREMWGIELPVDFDKVLPQHTCSDVTWAPEGIVVAVRCLACGGRYGALIDMRPACGAADPQKAVEADLAAIESYLQGIWIPEHEGCTRRPRPHHMPGLVHAFIGAAEEAIRQTIHEGEPVGFVFHLLDTRGRVHAHPATEISAPFGSTERRNEIAAVQFALREAVRVQRIDLLAAAVVVGAWMADLAEVANGPPGEISEVVCPPSQAPSRKEVAVLGLVTPTYGVGGLGLIHRMSARPGRGRGMLAPIEWSTEGIHSPLLDTLLVTSDGPPRP